MSASISPTVAPTPRVTRGSRPSPLAVTTSDLIAVGVGKNIDESELHAIASDPIYKNTLISREFDNLDSLLVKVRESICKSEWQTS